MYMKSASLRHRLRTAFFAGQVLRHCVQHLLPREPDDSPLVALQRSVSQSGALAGTGEKPQYMRT